MGIALAGVIAAGTAGVAFAQNAAGGAAAAPGAQAGGAGGNQGGGQGGGGRGGRGNFDPAQMRQAMMDRIKESLGASDEDWKILQPKIEKVTTLQAQVRSGSMFGGRRGGPGGGDGGGVPTNDVDAKAQELRTVLDKKDATNDDLAQKVTALRTAREKARTEIAKAQMALRETLTPRQEAQLVLVGILD
jgi:Spy/CpxP family protein refolding chaperone